MAVGEVSVTIALLVGISVRLPGSSARDKTAQLAGWGRRLPPRISLSHGYLLLNFCECSVALRLNDRSVAKFRNVTMDLKLTPVISQTDLTLMKTDIHASLFRGTALI